MPSIRKLKRRAYAALPFHAHLRWHLDAIDARLKPSPLAMPWNIVSDPPIVITHDVYIDGGTIGAYKPFLRPMTDEEVQAILDGKREMLKNAEVTWPKLYLDDELIGDVIGSSLAQT